MIVYSIPSLMSRAASDCTGRPIRNVWINKQTPSVWHTGAFTSAVLHMPGVETRPFPITSELGGSDADLLFEVACRKSGDSDSRKVAVNLHLHDSYGGLWTTVSVICPPDISTLLDFDRMGLGLSECPKPKNEGHLDEHLIYTEERADCYGMTLVEDIPHCREVISSLCRELTAQLYDLGYWLRPFISRELESAGEEPAGE